MGIGTAAPSSKLEVNGAITAHSQSIITVTNPTVYNAIGLALNSTNTGNTNFGFQESGVTKGGFGWAVADDYAWVWNAVASSNYVHQEWRSDGTTRWNNTDTGVEVARLTKTGSLGLGSSGPDAKLDTLATSG